MSGQFVSSITIDFHTHDDDLDDNTLLHVFVKNRASDSADSDGPTSYVANHQDYQDHDADRFGKNPYLGCAINANAGDFGNDSTHRVNIHLRSKPIPVEEILLPAVHIHILPDGNDTWKFDYTLTITLDDGTMLPSFSSNVNGLTGIILDQDNRNYYGICSEFRPGPARPVVPDTDAVLTGVTIEFHTHKDSKKSSGTKLGVHIVNRQGPTTSQDIAVANDVAAGHEFPGSDDAYVRVDLKRAGNAIFLRDMILPLVYINIAADDDDPWAFDYRLTLFFGQEQPYSWSVSGVVLNSDHHKHMGVYNGRAFPAVYCPHPPLTSRLQPRNKDISLAFVGQKLTELLNGRQMAESPDPLIKVKLDSAQSFGDQIPPSFADIQFITNNPPPPDGPLPQPPLGTTYTHSVSEIDQSQLNAKWGLAKAHLNDINSESLSLSVTPGDNQTPLTLDLQFETKGPDEVTITAGPFESAASYDVNQFKVKILLTLRLRHPDPDNNFAPVNAVDLFGWVDDINAVTFDLIGMNIYQIGGTFLGQPLSGVTSNRDDYKSSELIGKVVRVDFTTTGTTDFGGSIQKQIREGIFNKLSEADPITKVTLRDSLNAQLTSWLLGGVIASGNGELLAYPNPCTLIGVSVHDDVLSLSYFGPKESFVFQDPGPVVKPAAHELPPYWPDTLPPGTLANIDHIVVLTQENRSFDHLLGYLSLPLDKGGMNRTDVDGLKGGEFNEYNGQQMPSFRFAAGQTIFSPGPPNDPKHVAIQVNGGHMDGFAQAQADAYSPEAARYVMGYHTADNVPTYDSLARDFAIGHRWFAPHPGPTFPNRFYQLTGRPNIDPWGAWEYANTSPPRPAFGETIFEHLTDRGVSWAYFEHYYCFLRYFEKYTFDSENVVSYNDSQRGFLALAKAGNLPSVSFVDPHFVDYPPGSFCDEPPSDLRNSQPFIRTLVEALVASPKWDKTLLVIVYDEHGGFYDHVPPVPAAQVSHDLLPTTGLRVPCFVISPWVQGGTVFGSDALHFDHTSILKTIARRFLSDHPPHLGARYAAAHDLSEVLDAQLRPGQFRPFIPYNLTRASGMRLDVQYAGTAIGTPLWQYPPNETEAQRFRFEDAGDGFVYIRTLAGLYVTVNAPSGASAGTGAALSLKQDLKHEPGSQGAQSPDLQRWRFTASSVVTVIHRSSYSVSCAAFPGKVLQPLDGSTASEAAVVLADPPSHSQITLPSPWTVTSPLLPSPTATNA
jgi:phospholipase C